MQQSTIHNPAIHKLQSTIQQSSNPAIQQSTIQQSSNPPNPPNPQIINHQTTDRASHLRRGQELPHDADLLLELVDELIGPHPHALLLALRQVLHGGLHVAQLVQLLIHDALRLAQHLQLRLPVL
eukprot:14016124-Alexandrium_andersonii.AAC.1